MTRPHYSNWYSTARWKRLAKLQLQKQPLCQISLALGLIVAADTVDHIKPHRGDWDLFIDENNLQSVSKQMHDTICQQMECGNWQPSIGLDGWPIESEYLNKIYAAKKPNKSRID